MRRTQWASIAALCMASAVALAGYVQPLAVVVTLNADGSGSAMGDMLTARNSSSSIVMIGCGVRRYDNYAGGARAYGFCQARAEDGTSGFCFTENSELLEGLASIGDYSSISFSWNLNGECRQVGASTQSMYLP